MTGEEALRKALDDAESGLDAIPATALALGILRAEAGEGPMPELPEDEPGCTCPPELRDRGGFSSSCRACCPEPSRPADRPIGRCGDDRECMSQCGTGPCSRRCQVCQRLAGLPGEPCPACPDSRFPWPLLARLGDDEG